MKLRRPDEKLAGCVWLARFVDKARLHHRGQLEEDFARVFCHPLATDGTFLKHFGITEEEILSVIAREGEEDEGIAHWFAGRPGCSPERIAEWNQLAPNLGKEGYPMRRAFLWAKKNFYGGQEHPEIDSVFAAIAYDEG